MPTWIENFSSSVENQELLDSQVLQDGVLKSAGIKDIREVQEWGRLSGKELGNKQEQFKNFLDLPDGYTVKWIFYNWNEKKFRVQVEFTPKEPMNFKTPILTTLYFKKEYVWKDSSLHYQSYQLPYFKEEKNRWKCEVNEWQFACYDTIFDIPNLSDKTKNYKKLPFKAEYNEQKTDDHCRRKLEWAKLSCAPFSIDKNIPVDIKEEVMYTERNSRTYENSILNQFNLKNHLTWIQLDKNVQKEGEFYVKKLVINNWKENIPLNMEIKYKIDNMWKLVMDPSSRWKKTIEVDWFTFKNITIESDQNNPLNVKIKFDPNELKQYWDYMKRWIVKIYNIVKNPSISANTPSFTNLQDKRDYYQWSKEDNQRLLNIQNLEWYYRLKVNNTTSIPLVFDGKNVKLKDKYWQNVSAMIFEYNNNGKKNQTTTEVTDDGLQLTDKPEKFKDYKYLDFQLQWMNYQDIQWYYTWWNPNFLLTWKSWWNVKNLSKFNVGYDRKTGYSFEKANNKVKLEAKYFYDKLPKVWDLSGKVAWFSDVALKELFDKKFREKWLAAKEVEWAIIDNKYCSIDVKEKTHITIKPWSLPPEVEQILKDIENLKRATETIAWYSVKIDGKKLEDIIWGMNGVWSYFKIKNISSESPILSCSITQLSDVKNIKDADINFNYQSWATWANFVLDNNSQTITVGKTSNYKVNIKGNTIDLKLK